MTETAKRHLPILVDMAASEIHAISTRAVRDFLGNVKEHGKLTCKPGCSNCCYHPHVISVLEGITIYRQMRKASLWTTTLEKALKEHSAKIGSLSVGIWALAEISCPLLTKDNLCSIYPMRPGSCQVTVSRDTPDSCHPHNLGESLLNRDSYFKTVTPAERSQLVDRLKKPYIRLPISTALLIAKSLECEETSWGDLILTIKSMLGGESDDG